MCGIYITNIPFKDNQIYTKLESINFRGPDATGVRKVGNITLGHLRLSIIDVAERSNQPFLIDHLHIVFNGEIYNYISIRDDLIKLGYTFKTESDTEVLLMGYRVWGEAILSRLNGMFAFAIYDEVTQEIFCARDRLGVKPFYYYFKDGLFEICSQLRPLADNKTINEESVSLFLEFGYVPSPNSILNDVNKLSPGSLLKIDLKSNRLITNKYWDLQQSKITSLTYSETKDKLEELLEDAIKIRLRSDVPIGSFLSGGIDSALVTSIASKLSKEQLNTFSIGFDDPKYDESKIAKSFSKILNTKHTETICKPKDALNLMPKLIEVYDEPFADSSALPTLLLNSLTKKHITVALSGDGGDESFFGYNFYTWIAKLEVFFKIPYSVRKRLPIKLISKLLKKPLESLQNVVKYKSVEGFIIGYFKGFDSLLLSSNTKWINKHYNSFKINSETNLQKAADLNIKLWLENDSNVKVDRASMAYAVEVRSPFLDYRIIEFCRTLPVKYRYNNGIRKRLLRDLLVKYIPEKVFNQPKSGFSIPLHNWLRNELKVDLKKEFTDDFFNKVPNLDIKKFKKQFANHMSGKHDHSRNIWKLYVLAKWYKEFNF